MRDAVVLTYVAAALLCATPWIPAIEDVLIRNLSGGGLDTTLSFVEVARAAAVVDEAGPPAPWTEDQEFPSWHARFVSSHMTRVDGRPECVGAAVLSAAAVALALLRRARHAWILAAALAGAAAWTWFRLRGDLYDNVRWLPGGLEGTRVLDWILPWPWIAAGTAAALLAAASWRARRVPRPPAVKSTKEIFE